MKKIFPKITIGLALSISIIFTSCFGTGPVEINSVKDLEGKIIGCQSGTTGENFAHESSKAKTIKLFKNGVEGANALKNKAIDALILDELPAKEIVKINPELSIVDDQFSPEEYAIAVKKGNKELLDSINKSIHKIKQDGTYQKLISSFMPVDGNITIPKIEILNVKDVVKMGTNAAFPPFEYVKNSEVVGFDASLSRIIARDYNKKLQIIDISFEGLIPALQAGTIDFIAAGMTATEERRMNVDFSEPYYKTHQVIVVRK